jgi:hypothetical protein
MRYSSHGHQTLPTTKMKTLSVQLAPQHLIPKTTKPNLNQHSKIKKFSKTKTSKLKRTQNSTKSLESKYSTRCQEYQIPAPTKETFLYTTTFTLQTKNQNQNQNSLPKKKKPNPNQNLWYNNPKHKKNCKTQNGNNKLENESLKM